jgi:hypothetical protein
MIKSMRIRGTGHGGKKDLIYEMGEKARSKETTRKTKK